MLIIKTFSFSIWCYTLLKGPKSLIWQVAFIATIWAIWRLRNRVAFQQECFDEKRCFDMFYFDLS